MIARNWTEWDAEAAVAERVLDLIFKRANSLSPELPPAREPHRGKLRRVISDGKPIHLILPAFPAKSPNPEKTLGHLPDFGEVLALHTLEKLCLEIGEFYAPGAFVTICSDGRVFGDLVQVSDANVDEYGSGIDAIVAQYNFAHLKTYGLEHAFPELDGPGMRERLVSQFARTPDEVREMVLSREDYRALFNGIHRFLFEDQSAVDATSSRNRIRERTKVLAYEVISRSNAWSGLVEERFPEAVRLSIHPQPAVSSKIGIKLVEGADRWRTPWHGVVIFDGAEFRLTTRKAAEAASARLVTEGSHRYFTLGEKGVAPCV